MDAKKQEKIVRLEEKIWRIQKSTKTLFPIFALAHERLRNKSKLYYRWHLMPFEDSFHWAALLFYIIAVFFLSFGILSTNTNSKATINSYYVRVDGDDAVCNGLADVASTGFSGTNQLCAVRNIQKGLDVSGAGDSVIVGPGTYLTQIIINHPVNLKSGLGATNTIINGNSIDNPYEVQIYSSNVTFDGFTVTNPLYDGGSDPSGIVIGGGTHVSNILVTNNIVHDVCTATRSPASFGTTGIVGGPSDNVEVSYNKIYNIWHDSSVSTNGGAAGIVFWGNDATDYPSAINIHDNTIDHIISPLADAGIRIDPFYKDLTITNNTIYTSEDSGIWMLGSNFNASIISNNHINGQNTSQTGIKITSQFPDLISGNTISNFEVGILNNTDSTVSPIIHENSLMSNSNLNIQNLTTNNIDASKNWFNTYKPVEILPTLSHYVTYKPFYVNSEKTILSPAIMKITTNIPDGNYTTGEIISLDVVFNEPIDVTGNPRIKLATNPERFANYSSGSGTDTLIFNYAVMSGDNSQKLDYSSISSLELNGGSIKDDSGNGATITLPQTGSFSNIHSISINENTTKTPTSTPTVSATPKSVSGSINNAKKSVNPENPEANITPSISSSQSAANLVAGNDQTDATSSSTSVNSWRNISIFSISFLVLILLLIAIITYIDENTEKIFELKYKNR